MNYRCFRFLGFCFVFFNEKTQVIIVDSTICKKPARKNKVKGAQGGGTRGGKKSQSVNK